MSGDLSGRGDSHGDEAGGRVGTQSRWRLWDCKVEERIGPDGESGEAHRVQEVKEAPWSQRQANTAKL